MKHGQIVDLEFDKIPMERVKSLELLRVSLL